MANKHETAPSMGKETVLLLNLIKNDSVAMLSILPSARNIEKGAVIDWWNHPIKSFELRNENYLGLIFNKEIHVRQSTKGSPCSDLLEETYYQVYN